MIVAVIETTPLPFRKLNREDVERLGRPKPMVSLALTKESWR